MTALTNGEVDIIHGIDASVVDTITGGGCELFDEDGMNINYMAFRNDSGQFTAVEARRAFCQAVNVEEMVKSLYGDYAGVATSVMPLWMAPYAEKVTRTEYDPDAAKAAFAELGITSCTMLTYTNPRPYNTIGGQALAEAIQGYLARWASTWRSSPMTGPRIRPRSRPTPSTSASMAGLATTATTTSSTGSPTRTYP